MDMNRFQEGKENAFSQFFGPPTNCSEIGMLGYTLNGYYLVKSSDPVNKNKILVVYCTFRQAQGVTMLGKQGNEKSNFAQFK